MAKKGGGSFKGGMLSALTLFAIIAVIFGWGKTNDINSVKDGYDYFKSWSDKAFDCGADKAEWTCEGSGSNGGGSGSNNNSDKSGSGSNTSKPNNPEEAKKDRDKYIATLETLKEGSQEKVDYKRSEWKHWIGNPCDTRETVLKNQGKNVKTDSKTCKALSGTWVEPYANETFTDASKLDIDHIVPLSYAAKAGGNNWDAKKKEQFANDQSQLLAVSASENRKKSDKGPGDYMPPNKNFHCDYSKKWVDTVKKYDLAISDKDKRALKVGLQKC